MELQTKQHNFNYLEKELRSHQIIYFGTPRRWKREEQLLQIPQWQIILSLHSFKDRVTGLENEERQKCNVSLLCEAFSQFCKLSL